MSSQPNQHADVKASWPPHLLVGTPRQFAHSDVCASIDGREAAEQIALKLVRPGLRHVMVFCDGFVVNGTSFAKALRKRLPEGICATGRLAADADLGANRRQR